MGNRQLPNSFRAYQVHQHQYHATSDRPHYVGTTAANNASITYGTDNLLRSDADFLNYSQHGNRFFSHPQPHSRMNVPYFHPAGSAPLYDYQTSSSTGGSVHPLPENRAAPPYTSFYHGDGVNDFGSGLLDPAMGMRRGPFKRKSAAIPAFDGSGSNRYFHEGSSSGSGLTPGKAIQDYQDVPPGPPGLPVYRSNGLAISADDSRNVRSRSGFNMGPPPVANHCGYPPPDYPSNSLPLHNSGNVYMNNVNANATGHGWGYSPMPSHIPGRISTSDMSARERLERRAPDVGLYNRESVHSDINVPTPQHFSGPPMDCHGTHSQRIVPYYGGTSSFPGFHYEAASSLGGPQLIDETQHSHCTSQPRPSFVGVRHRHRYEPVTSDRFPSFMTPMDINDPMEIETGMAVDRFHNRRDMYDQYGDMRLDVDNMSYEELLALGERIGTVSTGLLEGAISESLVKITCNPVAENVEAGNCAICLEEFMCMDEVGRLKNCSHEYHMSCIKRWLSMKNVCPICKGPADAAAI